MWRVWIEMFAYYCHISHLLMSPSVWRVWIEIDRFGFLYFPIEVTLRVEGVD